MPLLPSLLLTHHRRSNSNSNKTRATTSLSSSPTPALETIRVPAVATVVVEPVAEDREAVVAVEGKQTVEAVVEVVPVLIKHLLRPQLRRARRRSCAVGVCRVERTWRGVACGAAKRFKVVVRSRACFCARLQVIVIQLIITKYVCRREGGERTSGGESRRRWMFPCCSLTR